MLEQHNCSKAFPPMSDDELTSLAKDIKANGLKEAIVLHEGKVLDGWHRYLACQMADVEVRAKDYQGSDPIAYVRSKNLYRRNMTALPIEYVETYLGAL